MSRIKRARAEDRVPRIFLGLVEVSGYYTNLASAFRKSGIDVSACFLIGHHFQYGTTNPLNHYRWSNRLQIEAGVTLTFAQRVLRIFLRLHHFCWSIRQHDVFIFAMGKSFLPLNLDLPILRMCRKRVIAMVGHGSEARPAYLDGAHWSNLATSPSPISELGRIAKKQQRHMRRLEFLASDLIAHPLASQFLTRLCISSTVLGLPHPAFTPNRKEGGEAIRRHIRVVHAPSNRQAKGSDVIQSVVASVSCDFPEIRYCEIHGLKNEVVLRELSDADLVIDQLYSDTRLSGLGMEAAHLGVPVLVGSYGAQIMEEVTPKEFLPPACVVHPEDLEPALRDLLTNPGRTKAVGDSAKAFVSTQWSDNAVAARFLSIARGSTPRDWYFEPRLIRYVHGSGLSETEIREIFSRGLRDFGRGFFRLHRRPDIFDELMNLRG